MATGEPGEYTAMRSFAKLSVITGALLWAGARVWMSWHNGGEFDYSPLIWAAGWILLALLLL